MVCTQGERKPLSVQGFSLHRARRVRCCPRSRFLGVVFLGVRVKRPVLSVAVVAVACSLSLVAVDAGQAAAVMRSVTAAAAAPVLGPRAKVAKKAATAGVEWQEVAQALDSAKASGAAVTVESLTSQFSLAQANTDGESLSSRLSVSPERVRVDGQWRDVDMTLGSVDSVVEPAVAGNTVRFSSGSAGPLASVGTAAGLLGQAASSMTAGAEADFADVGRANTALDPLVSLGFPGGSVDAAVGWGHGHVH